MRKDLIGPLSRYAQTDTATLTLPDGRQIGYLKRRFVPPMENFDLIQEHLITQGDRLDNLAALYLGDPEQFWRLCDANGAMLPDDVLEIGKRLRITLPEGIPAPTRE
jgi:hypothetical protein